MIQRTELLKIWKFINTRYIYNLTSARFDIDASNVISLLRLSSNVSHCHNVVTRIARMVRRGCNPRSLFERG